MAFVDVTKSCLDSIRQISEHIEDAIVYLDAGCTESFQLVGAFPIFLDLGVRAVCSLENTYSLDVVADWNGNYDPAKKIVIMTSRLLSDAHRYILRTLSMHQGVLFCSIFTSISEVAHSAYPDSPLGPDAFHEYESLLLQDYEELIENSDLKSGRSVDNNTKENLTFEDEGWSRVTSTEEDIPSLEASSTGKNLYGNNPRQKMVDLGPKLIVSVHHFPMILCPFSPKVFVLPSEGSIAEACLSAENEDSLSAGLPSLSTGLPSDGDEVPPAATLTAHFLYHLVAKMDLKMEIFSLGDLSKTIGKILTDMSSLYDVGRRKRTVGLLLIDRTLDLLTPCCHGDSLVDRIFSALPRKERISSSTSIKSSQAQLIPGSLERASLEVQIPIGEILTEEDPEIDDSGLSNRIEAFLCGWDSYNSAPEMVDLINLCKKASDQRIFPAELLQGSLVSTESFRGTPYLEAILDRRTKDGAILVKKWLQETLRRENMSTYVKTRPGLASKSELKTMIKALAKRPSSLIRNGGIIQLATAALSALDESCSVRWDAFISAEKILSVNAGDTSQSLAAQISDLINKSAFAGSDGKKKELSHGLLSFQDALLLTITGYILAGENFPTSGSSGPFSWQEEHFLKEAILDAILENPSVARLKFLHGLTPELEAKLNKPKSDVTKETSIDHLDIDDFDDEQWGKWGDEDEENDNKELEYDDMQLKLELRDRVDTLFKYLHKFSSLKSKNRPLREGPLASESNLTGDPYTNKGLLYKLLTKILGKFDVPGLEYHSSTVGRLFKSGFGRFGLGQANPSVADQNVILVFVVGGINGVEVQEAHEALSESGRPDIELILGGTTFLTPDDMLDLLLGQPSYI
ncbi:sec1 family domain-containing protein MIP3 isoform X2 [Hibiscus syriacus]|nr:sec1 family domain-containing protein MIP3 isoform X2 [Hibiscus syriacus]XP_039067092.1 sec1 family domain-containing protein MIP3 isoform X2 [Hibiscus syriacus]